MMRDPRGTCPSCDSSDPDVCADGEPHLHVISKVYPKAFYNCCNDPFHTPTEAQSEPTDVGLTPADPTEPTSELDLEAQPVGQLAVHSLEESYRRMKLARSHALKERDEARSALTTAQQIIEELRRMLMAAAWPFHAMSPEHPDLPEWAQGPTQWVRDALAKIEELTRERDVARRAAKANYDRAETAESLITETVKWCEEEAEKQDALGDGEPIIGDLAGLNYAVASALRSCAAKLKENI